MAIGLSKTRRKLLKQVNNRPHATDDDHEQDTRTNDVSTPQESSKPFDADPESSSNELSRPMPLHTLTSKSPAKFSVKQSIHKPVRKRCPPGVSNDSADSVVSDQDLDLDLPDEPDTRYKPAKKTQKTLSVPRKSRVHVNIHDPPPKIPRRKLTDVADLTNGICESAEDDIVSKSLQHITSQVDPLTSNTPGSVGQLGSQNRRVKTQGYGKSTGQRSTVKKSFKVPMDVKIPDPTAKRLKIHDNIDTSDHSSPLSSNRELRLPSHHDLVEQYGSRNEFDYFGSSSPRSVISSDIQEVNVVDLCESTAPGMVICQICGDHVSESFRDDFELENCRGKRMNIRMQQRFCKAHKLHHAQETYDVRRYPAIDWGGLDDRMMRHNQRLRDMIAGRATSYYKNDAAIKVRQKKISTKAVAHDLNAGNTAGAATTDLVGYYGSRGAKLMTEHILDSLSKELRRMSGTEALVGIKGSAGGVSGYVRSVLVPELAVLLVMDDYKVDAERAREIVLESADVGALLNDEQDETMTRFDDPDTIELDD